MSSHGSKNNDKVMGHAMVSMMVVVSPGGGQADCVRSGAKGTVGGAEKSLLTNRVAERVEINHTDYAAEARHPIKAPEALPITIPWHYARATVAVQHT